MRSRKSITHAAVIFLTLSAVYLYINSNGTLSSVQRSSGATGHYVFFDSSNSEGPDEKVAQVMLERKRLVDEQCLTMAQQKKPSSWANLWWLQQDNALWCPVFKAASTTWTEKMFNRSRALDTESKLAYMKGHSHVQWMKHISKSFHRSAMYKNMMKTHDPVSFIIVRHPFHRLVSAFRSKLERVYDLDYKKNWYYQRYGSKIVKAYREEAIKHLGSDYFSEENNFGAIVPVQGVRVQELPTFWEFVKWLLKEPDRMRKLDEHWRPIFTYCGPCVVDYKYIIHFENLDSEGQFLLSVLGDEKREAQSAHVNANKVEGFEDEELVKLYFSVLSRDDVLRLYNLYEEDFRLFNYTYRFRDLALPL